MLIPYIVCTALFKKKERTEIKGQSILITPTGSAIRVMFGNIALQSKITCDLFQSYHLLIAICRTQEADGVNYTLGDSQDDCVHISGWAICYTIFKSFVYTPSCWLDGIVQWIAVVHSKQPVRN